jgi:hypothetical protein
MITFGGSILKYGSQWLTDAETPPVLPLNFQPGDLVFRTPSHDYDYQWDGASPVKYIPEQNYWEPTNSSDPTWMEQGTENGLAYIINMKSMTGSLADIAAHCLYKETVVGYWDNWCDQFAVDGGDWRDMQSALMFVDVKSLDQCFNLCTGLEKLQIVTAPDASYTLFNLGALCRDCSSLVDLNLTYLDTSHVTDFSDLCSGCSSLHYAPKIDTTSGQYFLRAFHECDLYEVPQYYMPVAIDVERMFSINHNVTTGALSLYNQIKDNVGIRGQECFEECGDNTDTGLADLAQIPYSWGGNLPPEG